MGWGGKRCPRSRSLRRNISFLSWEPLGDLSLGRLWEILGGALPGVWGMLGEFGALWGVLSVCPPVRLPVRPPVPSPSTHLSARLYINKLPINLTADVTRIRIQGLGPWSQMGSRKWAPGAKCPSKYAQGTRKVHARYTQGTRNHGQSDWRTWRPGSAAGFPSAVVPDPGASWFAPPSFHRKKQPAGAPQGMPTHSLPSKILQMS